MFFQFERWLGGRDAAGGDVRHGAGEGPPGEAEQQLHSPREEEPRDPRQVLAGASEIMRPSFDDEEGGEWEEAPQRVSVS